MTRVTVRFLENDACEVVRGRAKSKQISCWCPPDETKANKFRVGARLTRRNFSCPTFFRSAGVLPQPQIRRLRRIFDMYRCGLSMSAPLYDHDVEPIQSTLLQIHFPRDSILSHVRAVSGCAISNFTCQVVKLFVTHAPLPPLHAPKM